MPAYQVREPLSGGTGHYTDWKTRSIDIERKGILICEGGRCLFTAYTQTAMSHETPILVAPRPVYFFTRADDLKVSFNDPALEEFLSILKPSGVANLTKRPYQPTPTKSSPRCENARDIVIQQGDSAVDLPSISKDTVLEPDPSRNWLSSTLLCEQAPFSDPLLILLISAAQPLPFHACIPGTPF